MSVSGSSPDPSRIDRARSTSCSTNSSLTLSCTNTRAPGDAALALVEEHGAVRARKRRVEIGVAEDDARRLPTELERHALQVPLRRLDDLLTGGVLTGERDLVDVGV